MKSFEITIGKLRHWQPVGTFEIICTTIAIVTSTLLPLNPNSIFISAGPIPKLC